MFASILSQHAPLIRDYPGAPPTPPAPPAPPTPLEPPQAEPIAFGAVTRASLFGIIGSAVSSTTLATITCADAAMTIRQSEVVAGLTFSYSAGVLTIAGTPTGSTRVQRVVVSYIASGGSNTVRGSTSHEITLVNASEVLTIGSMAGASGRVGRPLTATLASPSANYLVGVTAHPGTAVPGLAATLAWTEASPTSSGTLTLAGTPTLAGTYSLTVNYRNGAVDLGTSTHAVVIAAAYETPAPAPAPTPAPPAPSPSPPPAPTPAPAPGLGPDPTLADVRLLMRFDTGTATLTTTLAHKYFVGSYGSVPGTTITLNETLLPGQSIEVVEVLLFSQNESGAESYSGPDVTVSGTTITIPQTIPINNGYSVSYRIVSVFVGVWAAAIGPSLNGNGPTLTAGAAGQGALFSATPAAITGTVAALDGVAEGLSVECMADIGATAWSALVAPGGDQRFCPVVSYTAADGSLLWALGFLSRMVNVGILGATPFRRVDAMFWTALDDAFSLTSASSSGTGGVIARPAKFVHLAGVLKQTSAASWERASWLGGEFCLSRVQTLQSAPAARQTGTLKIGSTCAAFRTYDALYPLTTIVPFSGAVDELRIKTPGQYADLMNGGTPAAITLARRVIPWPNY